MYKFLSVVLCLSIYIPLSCYKEIETFEDVLVKAVLNAQIKNETEAKLKYAILSDIAKRKGAELIYWEQRKPYRGDYAHAQAYYVYGCVTDPDFYFDFENEIKTHQYTGNDDINKFWIYEPLPEHAQPIDHNQWKKIKEILEIPINGQTISEVARSKVKDACVSDAQCKLCKDAKRNCDAIEELYGKAFYHVAFPEEKS